MSAGFVFTIEKNFVPILYQMPAFGAFDGFSDFVESISCETSESCQGRGSNPCPGRPGPPVCQRFTIPLLSGYSPQWYVWASKRWATRRWSGGHRPTGSPTPTRTGSRRGAIEGDAVCTVTWFEARYSWTLFGPYARDREGPPRTGPPPTFNGLGR